MRTPYLDKAAGKPANTAPAVEGIDTNAAAVLETKPVLSLEEEIVVLQEANDLQVEVETGLEEATRVEDVSDNLLNLADNTADIEVLTPQQAALIDTAAEMAVAGTDTDPDLVIPSMESFIGKSLSIEGFKETAANIWKQIREFVEKLWEKIRQFWHNIFSVFPRQLARIKAMRELIAAKKKDGATDPKHKVISIMVGINSLSYPGYLVKNVKELQTGLADLRKLGDWSFGQYTQSVKRQGDIITDELKSFDPMAPAKSLESTRKKLSAANFSDVLKAPANGYMGCFELKFRRIDPKKSTDLSDAQVLNALRHTYVAVVGSQASSQRVINLQGGIATPTLAEVETTLTSVENLVKMAAAFETSANFKAMESTKQAMAAAGNAAYASYTKVADTLGKSEGSFSLDVMRSLMNFNTVYTKWSASYTSDYIKRLLNATRASLVFCEKSIAQY